MKQTPSSPQATIKYTPDFTAFLAKLEHPVAIVSPALFEILGKAVSESRVEEALQKLGFSEMRAVSFDKHDFTQSLLRESDISKDNPVFFTACPLVRNLVTAEYPRHRQLFSAILPPADRSALAARKDYPEAALILISPCSARAEALLPAVDYIVPLYTIFPALLSLLGLTREALQKNEGYCAASYNHADGSGGRIRVVGSCPDIRAFFNGFSEGTGTASSSALDSADKKEKPPREAIVEMIACRGGCSEGDWAPKL